MVSPTPEALLQQAHDALDQGRLDVAERALRALLTQDPESRDGWLALTLVHAERGAGDDALQCVDRALDQAPEDPVLLLTRAGLLLDLHDAAEDALPLLEELAQRVAEHAAEHASGHMEAGGPDDGWDALALETQVRLAEARGALHDTAGALEAARAAVGLAPTDTAARLALARALFDRVQLDEAAEVLRTLLADAPATADAHWLLGRTLLVQGLLLDADAAFGDAAAADPGRYAPPLRLEARAFAALLDDVVALLPAPLRAPVKRAGFKVELAPTPDVLLDGEPPLEPTACVRLEGTPPDPTVADVMAHFPRRVVVYQRNIELLSGSVEEARETLAALLTLEVARFLGLEDPRAV